MKTRQSPARLAAGLLAAVLGLWPNGVVAAPLRAPVVSYQGMCDASAAIDLGQDIFAVANDEDNRIRLYHRTRGGNPVGILDLTSFMGLSRPSKEVDLEGASRIGDVVYWISSHGRDAKGKPAVDRHRFFATTIDRRGATVELHSFGQPYRQLLEDFIADPRLRRFQLKAAAQRAPKEAGGLNIEGLCATPDGHLLIGFRNPIPDGKALVVPVLNPAEVVAGQRARLGEPLLLDLGGLGIRSMEAEGGRYYIIAGPHDGRAEFGLYQWNGGTDRPRRMPEIELAGLNPEAIQFYKLGQTARAQILSDDGGEKIGCDDCKKLKNPADQRFRATSFVFHPDGSVEPAALGSSTSWVESLTAEVSR